MSDEPLFQDVIRKRQSVRKFEAGRTIGRDALRRIVDCGRRALSGAKVQCWDFIVVDDRTMRDNVMAVFLRHTQRLVDHANGFPAVGAVDQPSLNSVDAIQSKLKELDMSSTLTQARGGTRLNVLRLFALGTLLIFPATSMAQQSPPIAQQIAKTYGLDSFGQIEAIRYTWNAEFPGGHKVSNKWEWSPKTDTVSYEGKDKEGKPVKVTYQRAQLAGQSDVVKKEIDPAFANDQYWLLLPFHLLWDGATATDEGQQKRPTGDASAQKVVMKYPSEGGYQPGDAWDLYIGADKRIEEIAYHRGASNPPHLVTAKYTDYKNAGPLLISTDHPGVVDGKPFRINLADVSVKLTGSDNWIDAK